MLTKILSISGKPGLYKLISTNKNIHVVESLSDGKRIPAYLQEKIVALSDVSVYTNQDDVPLLDVLKKIKEKENGQRVALSPKASNSDFFAFMEETLPDYDKNKVYASDIRKIISWYNILLDGGIDFDAVEKAADDDGHAAEVETEE